MAGTSTDMPRAQPSLFSLVTFSTHWGHGGDTGTPHPAEDAQHTPQVPQHSMQLQGHPFSTCVCVCVCVHMHMCDCVCACP